MSATIKGEQAMLSHDEWELVRQSHHPEIYERTREELESLQARLRETRAKERTQLRQTQRQVKGKAEPRGGSFPGNVEHARKRKQVFAGAVRRVNNEVSRLRKIEARKALTASARRALALRKSAPSFGYPTGETANTGAVSNPSKRGRSHVSGRKVGSVTKATQKAQAKRDG
jgi:hypothetical protein